jgi:hypothetical protein
MTDAGVKREPDSTHSDMWGSFLGRERSLGGENKTGAEGGGGGRLD